MASSYKGVLHVDTVKNKRSRTVPLVDELVPIIDKWPEGKKADDWLFLTWRNNAVDAEGLEPPTSSL
jgi:integrase